MAHLLSFRGVVIWVAGGSLVAGLVVQSLAAHRQRLVAIAGILVFTAAVPVLAKVVGGHTSGPITRATFIATGVTAVMALMLRTSLPVAIIPASLMLFAGVLGLGAATDVPWMVGIWAVFQAATLAMIGPYTREHLRDRRRIVPFALWLAGSGLLAVLALALVSPFLGHPWTIPGAGDTPVQSALGPAPRSTTEPAAGSQATSGTRLHSTTNLRTPHATPTLTAHATPRITAHATPRITPHATPRATPTLTAHAVPRSTPRITAHATPRLTAHATPHATQAKADHLASPRTKPERPRSLLFRILLLLVILILACCVIVLVIAGIQALRWYRLRVRLNTGSPEQRAIGAWTWVRARRVRYDHPLPIHVSPDVAISWARSSAEPEVRTVAEIAAQVAFHESGRLEADIADRAWTAARLAGRQPTTGSLRDRLRWAMRGPEIARSR